MKDLERLAKIMRDDWDRRIRHDFRFWMSDGYKDDATMWASGDRDLSMLLEGIMGTESMRYLEVGCGVGRLLKSAAARFKEVIGLDVSPEAIEKAQTLLPREKNLSLLVGNGLDLDGIPSASLDCVGVFAALCSVPTDVVARYLIEIHRVLKPGGHLRMQVYLGEEQAVGEEDTLHLRCYRESNFREAVERAGFAVDEIRDLVLPLEVSFESLAITAKIAFLRKREATPPPFTEISRLLMPAGETAGKHLDGDIEYWMTLNHAKSLVESGDVDRARKALEYAAAMSAAVTIDVGDLLQRIVDEVERRSDPAPLRPLPDTDYFDLNLEVIRMRFPDLAAQLTGRSDDEEDVDVRASNDGPVCVYKGQILDHAAKPISAAEGWVRRCLQEKRFAECEDIAVVGFGFGYHVEVLLKTASKPISVIEPSRAVFLRALRSRDLRDLLGTLKSIHVGELTPRDIFSESSELLIRPQSLVVYSHILPVIKEKFYGLRGLRSLRPTVMVLGPLQGGTLPMLNYTSRALASLGQRVRDLDMSPFAGGYHAINAMLKEPARQQVMHANYLEMCAQSVLESAIEKKIDILICMAQAPVTGRVLQELRARGVVTVLWFVEDYLRFTYWKEMAKFYDFVFTIQKGECLDLIKQAGAGEVHYLPAGCDPIVHTPMQLTPEERQEWGSPISFVGAGYHNRQQVFASFAEMPFKLWGTEWPGCKPFDRMLQKAGKRLAPEEYIKIFNATEVNINLHSSTERDGVDPYGDFVNPRTFELAAVGAFQLVDERSYLPDVFEEGKEIITFKNTADLKEKIAYYLNRPDERRAIGQRARERALREHTYGHRIREMLSVIYSSRFEHLRNRIDTNPWRKMLDRSARHTELHKRCVQAHERGEEPNLDGLVADIMVGQGKLSETEQKLLFLHHVRKQIIRMKQEESGQ